MSINEKKKTLKTFKTEPKLSHGYCSTTFHNLLRSDDPVNGHAETKMTFVPITVNKCREQISHIFTGEDPAKIKVSRKPVGYIPSHVMFNDGYFERNPRIVPEKKKRYTIEDKRKEDNKHPYSDEFLLSKNKKELMQRRVNENYLTNPLKILNKEENRKNNEELFKKNSNRTKVYNSYLGSHNYKRTIGGTKPKTPNKNIVTLNSRQLDKITNNDFDINKNAMIVNRDSDQMVPHYAKSHFRYTSCKHGNGYTFI